MDKFISCDWGTSNLRLRLINANDLTILAEENSDQGIAISYKMWQRQGKNHPYRKDFYLSILKNRLSSLSDKNRISVDNIPVIISGMASSSIGMVELSYKWLPFDLNGSDLEVTSLNCKRCSNDFLIISGVRTSTDVMRGEETKVVGSSPMLNSDNSEQLLICPGTHPKHIIIKRNKVTDFKTFMTGEFFNLLSKQSILSASLQKSSGDLDDGINRESFINGVREGKKSNLLHAAFMVRTNQLLKDITKEQNYFYLSGLLIGTELKELKSGAPVSIVGPFTLSSYYAAACGVFGVQVKVNIDADLALVRGHRIIFSQHYHK